MERISPSSLLLYAFDIQQSLWDNLMFIKHYLRWDKNLQRFQCEKSIRITYLAFGFQILVLLPFLLVYVYLFLRGLWSPRINTPMNWILSGTIFLAALLGIFYGTLEFLMRNEIVRFHNCEIQLLKDGNNDRGNNPATRIRIPIQNPFVQGISELLLRGDRRYLFGIFTCQIVVFCGVIPFLAPFALLILLLYYDICFDPFNLFLRSISQEGSSDTLRIIAVQLPITLYYFVTVSEFTRMISLALSISLQSPIYLLWILQKIERISKSNLQRSLHLYRAIMVQVTDAREYTSTIAFATMSVGYSLMMTSTSITFMGGFYLLPLPLFCVVAGVMLTCLTFLSVALPVGTCHFEVASDILREWKRKTHKLSGWKGRVLRKELNAIRPMSFYYGSMRRMDADAKMEYLDSISGRTIDSCLLFHESLK